ncbi:helix-turn-helix transcriptional regulator [Clostridium bornimense]|uniref:helix-turn-helix domain-containing protein n=1 Tax=Clostridium bornimense TaxID=1216932 RepID=UPI001C11C6C6|nr:helix-turn-helix transcriptional regulator [Clostridium bornimense]MBU5315426.1 helix-turn-helix transcriptional regulator [Clostridium bornimense]
MDIEKLEESQNKDIIEVLPQDDDCIIYKILNKTGETLMTSYKVFPGIEIVYNNVDMRKCSVILDKNNLEGNVFEINHCLEGRIECEVGGEFFYLTPGDMSINVKKNVNNETYFPTSHYYGVSIVVDANLAPRCLSCILDDVNVEPTSIMRKFCEESDTFIIRNNSHLDHIFHELYCIPHTIRKGYFKVKVLEILLFLGGISVDQLYSKGERYTKSQVLLAKKVCEFLSDNMEKRITIEYLSEKFHVSTTQLKNCFKGVYGVSIYAYIRVQKMQTAALLIKNTERTILDIASQYGYNNASKFAKAFKDVMGILPNQYRKEG